MVMKDTRPPNQRPLEVYRSRDLQRVPLGRGLVREFLEVLGAQARLPPRQDQVRRETKGIDPVARRLLLRGDDGPGLLRGLPLAVADQADLQAQVLL
jgi:hypothetical protein